MVVNAWTSDKVAKLIDVQNPYVMSVPPTMRFAESGDTAVAHSMLIFEFPTYVEPI